MAKLDPFIGANLHYGKPRTRQTGQKVLDANFGGKGKEATEWANRRPICPYGCGEEGELVEIVVEPGKGAIGYYKDSEQLVFTAPMKMQPKPSTKKLHIGPDGEPQLTEEESQ